MNYTYIALIPAAGSGQRLGGTLPKQYQPLNGFPMLTHTIHALQSHPAIEHVFVVLAPDDAYFKTLCAPHLRNCTPFYVGAATRAQSVLQGLKTLPSEAENAWVFVHDAARPCLHKEDLSSLVDVIGQQDHFTNTVKATGFILATPVADTLKRSLDDSHHIAETVSRKQLWQAQTPQISQCSILISALEQALSPFAPPPTDEAQALEHSNHRIKLIAAKHPNFKVTYRADQILAEALLAVEAKIV